jgi:hypothetical protein
MSTLIQHYNLLLVSITDEEIISKAKVSLRTPGRLVLIKEHLSSATSIHLFPRLQLA